MSMYEVTVSVTREGEDRNEQISEVIIRNESCRTAIGLATHAVMHSISDSDDLENQPVTQWPGGVH